MQLSYHNTGIIWSLDHTLLSVLYVKERVFSWSCDEIYLLFLEIKNALCIFMLPEFLSENTGKQGTNCTTQY